MLLFLFLIIPLKINVGFEIGKISNGYWNQSELIIENNIKSCDQCICKMLLSSSTIVGLNCLINNQICHLFTNYSNGFMTNNSNNIFYFRILPFKNQFIEIIWYFNNNTNDFYNIYNGIGINNISYSSLSLINNSLSLYLQSKFYQYVEILSPSLDLNNRSFTFELLINPFILNNSYFYGLIGQCTTSSTNQCLHLAIRNSYLFFGFFQNDCVGQTILNSSTWYHVAFVYSYELRRQIIYLNGLIDGERYSVDPYQGNSSTSLTIGMILPQDKQWSFDGLIDQISFINQAKTNSQIYDDAI
ncbi:hypothetical protein I4U23_005776 [Adineta vaga]|nr:hypothetical protein I4U23_005776 [Adineta vaga]